MKPVQAALLLAAIVSVCFFVNLPESRGGPPQGGPPTLPPKISRKLVMTGTCESVPDAALTDQDKQLRRRTTVNELAKVCASP